MSECPDRDYCARMGGLLRANGICQCTEDQQRDDEDRRRSELADAWDGETYRGNL